MEAKDSLLMVQAHGFCDELSQGTRIIDAVLAETARVGARKILVDFRDLDGMLTLAFHMELQSHAASRIGNRRCAFVFPPEAGAHKGPSPRARLAVFTNPSAALEWLHGRVAQVPTAIGLPPRIEHTLVHLI